MTDAAACENNNGTYIPIKDQSRTKTAPHRGTSSFDETPPLRGSCKENIPSTPEYVRVQIVSSFIVLLAYNQYVPVVYFLGLVEVGQPGRVLAHHRSRAMCRCLAFLSSPTYDYGNLSSCTALSSRSHFHLFLFVLVLSYTRYLY